MSGDIVLPGGQTLNLALVKKSAAGEVQLMATTTEAPAKQDTQDPKVDFNDKPVKTKKSPKIGKSFSSRNPTPIGAIGLVFIVVLLFAAFNASSLPLIGGGTTYYAMFSTSANLKPDDDVRVAGVKVGAVDSVSIDRKRGVIKVAMLVKDGWIGNESYARIKLRTLLGSKYIEVDSQGTKQLKEGATIPMSRTEAPFDVYPAFTSLTRTRPEDRHLAAGKALNTLSSDFSGTPASVKPVVRGLSRLSTTISSRDSQLRNLLPRRRSVTGVLASRDTDLQKILSDGNLLLSELNAPAHRHPLAAHQHPGAVGAAARAGHRQPGQDRPAADPGELGAVAAAEATRTTWTAASRCSARSTACSTTSSATAGGSTTTSRTSA